MPSSDKQGAANPAAAGWPPALRAADGNASEAKVEYLVSLRLDQQPTILFERMLVCDGVIAARRHVWTRSFDSTEEAELHHRWMTDRCDRMIFWASVSAASGPEQVFAEITNGVHLAMEEDERRREAASAEVEDDLRRSKIIESNPIERGGRFGIALERGNEDTPFWTIMFRERWERERFRDWFQWQGGHFAAWAEYLADHSAIELERLLLSQMLQAEKDLKASGLGAGGRRPLRFYRGEQ